MLSLIVGSLLILALFAYVFHDVWPNDIVDALKAFVVFMVLSTIIVLGSVLIAIGIRQIWPGV